MRACEIGNCGSVSDALCNSKKIRRSPFSLEKFISLKKRLGEIHEEKVFDFKTIRVRRLNIG